MPATAVRAVWLLLSRCVFAHPSGKQEGEEDLVLMRWNSLSKGLLILIMCSGLGVQVGNGVWWPWPESRSGWAALGEAGDLQRWRMMTSVIHTHRVTHLLSCMVVISHSENTFHSSKIAYFKLFFNSCPFSCSLEANAAEVWNSYEQDQHCAVTNTSCGTLLKLSLEFRNFWVSFWLAVTPPVPRMTEGQDEGRVMAELHLLAGSSRGCRSAEL